MSRQRKSNRAPRRQPLILRLQKPVLPYLLLTQDSRLAAERQALYWALHLSPTEIKTLREIAIQEQQVVRELYRASQSALLEEASSPAAKKQAVLAHNQGVAEAMATTDQAIRQLLGSRYPAFRVWIREWWMREQEAISRLKQHRSVGSPGVQSSAYSCYMFATQYHGYTNYEVALPDKYVSLQTWGGTFRLHTIVVTIIRLIRLTFIATATGFGAFWCMKLVPGILTITTGIRPVARTPGACSVIFRFVGLKPSMLITMATMAEKINLAVQ